MFHIGEKVFVLGTRDPNLEGKVATVIGWYSDIEHFSIILFDELVPSGTWDSKPQPPNVREQIRNVRAIVLSNYCLRACL